MIARRASLVGEGPDDVAGLERVGREGDRPDRAALRLEPRGDGVARRLRFCDDEL